MELFIRKPNADLYPGVVVRKNTVLEYKTEKIEQRVEGLVLHTVFAAKGDGYESRSEVSVFLNEGDILIFEENGRGYLKPTEPFCTVAEAVDELNDIGEVGDSLCSE